MAILERTALYLKDRLKFYFPRHSASMSLTTVCCCTKVAISAHMCIFAPDLHLILQTFKNLCPIYGRRVGISSFTHYYAAYKTLIWNYPTLRAYLRLAHPLRVANMARCFSCTSIRPNSSSSLGPVANATDVLQPWGLLYNPIPPSG